MRLIEELRAEIGGVRTRLAVLLDEPWRPGARMQFDKYIAEHEMLSEQIKLAEMISTQDFSAEFRASSVHYLSLLKEVS